MEVGHKNHLHHESKTQWSPSDSGPQETKSLKHEMSLQRAEVDGIHDRGNSPLPLKECLGFIGCLSLFGGGVGVLAVLGFLCFLWFGYGSEIEARNATRLWRLIALNDWMTRSITLTTLILRVIISSQLTVCTSMIAALILEKHFALKSNIARLSIIRSINNGPRELIQLILFSRSSILILNIKFWLIMVLAIVTIALQFSSTILVSDLNDFVIVGDFNHTQVPTLTSYQDGDTVYLDGSWLERPAVWTVFGEIQSQVNVTPDSNGFSSTGLVQRGFIPLEGSENRTSVRHYQGNAIVMYSKAVCMQPVIDAEYRALDQSAEVGIVDIVYGRIQGYLDYGASLRNAYPDAEALNSSQGLEGAYFDCNIPSGFSADFPQSSICLIGAVGGNFWTFDLTPKWNHMDNPWSPNSSIYLVYTTNMHMEDWIAAPQNQSILPGTPHGEWQSYSPLPGRYVNVSLCFSAFEMGRQSVDMATSDVPREPTAGWSEILLTAAQNYNFTEIENYISIGSNLSPQDRGLFDMTILGAPKDGPPSSPANNLTTISLADGTNVTTSFGLITNRIPESTMYNIFSNNNSPNSTIVSCFDCFSNGVDTSPNVAVLFNSIVTYTQRPAQAMQTLMTSVATTILDSYQSSLGKLQDAQLTTTTTIRTPGPCSQHGCAGFITIITLLCVHLLCVTAITALYVRQARYSRFGNVWHAVSQLMSDELKDTLQQGGDKSDETIEKGLQGEGGNYFMQLKKSSGDGKIRVVKLASNGGCSGDQNDTVGDDASLISRRRRSVILKDLKSDGLVVTEKSMEQAMRKSI